MLRPVTGASYYIGVDESSLATDMTIYPNPATSTLHLTGVNQGNSIVVYDLLGRPVISTSFTNEINISLLCDGLYVLRVTTTDGDVITKKFMVRK